MNKRLHNLFRLSAFTITFLLLSSTVWAEYCTPDFGYGPYDDDYIDGVELADISNFTGMGEEYNDYTDISTMLTPGLSYDLVLYNTPVWQETYQAWIDWDQDEEFEPTEKLSFTDLIIDEGMTGTINFMVPFDALPGATRMRILCVYSPDGELDPCVPGELYYYGEAEDYTIQIPAAGPYDLGVTGIVGIETGCGLGITPITVEITNLGTEPSGDFEVAYRVTDPVLGLLAPVVEDYDGPVIASFETVEFTFSSPANFTNLGDYNIESYTIYDVDIEPLDDASDESFTSVPTVTSYPYVQDFESGADGWMEGGSLSSWELGDPAGFAIIGAPPATPGSQYSWTTELDDYYNLNEKSYIISPCLDFSSLVLPYIEFDINYDIQLYDDGAKLQYSTDGGTEWTDVGGIGTGENWYNHMECYAMWPTFYIDSYNGWSGNSDGWLHAYHDLSFLAGEPNVRIRIVFASSNYWNFNDGFAFDNVRIADPYPNDVGVIDLVDPSSGPFLTASETVTITIKNFGTLEQSDFPVAYKLGAGSPVNEMFTGTIAPGMTATHTFGPTVDLSVDGDYTITAWTKMPGDEDLFNDTLITIVSNLEPITGTGAYYLYSNIGFEPWGTTSNSEHMDAVFGVGEWTTDYYETLDPAVVFGSGTCFVFMEGSDAHADEMEDFLDDNRELIENWVASGGHLFLNAAPNEGDGMDFGFDGTDLIYAWFTSDVDASDPDHPVFDGPFTPTATYMTGGSYGHAYVSGTEWMPILFDAFNPDRIICAEKTWGAGTVIFGGMTVTDYHAPLEEAGNFRKNIISYLAACTISDHDVGVQNILAPQTSCGLTGEEEVIIKVKNYGFLAQTNIPVSYQVDGGPIVTEIVPGPLEIGGTLEYTFDETVDLDALDEYEIFVWSELALDTITSNDSSDAIVINIPIIDDYPYIEDWESGEAGWVHYGTQDEWELGLPAGPVIVGPPPTTPSSQYSWTTDINDIYENGAMNYLESPCFDMSELILPYVEFDIWWDSEDEWDGTQLEYSTDAGATWILLGDLGTGDNWYTNFGIALGFDPVTEEYENGWVGYGTGWVTAHHDISFLTGETSVKFRFRFASDGIYTFDGVAIDNFNVQDPFPNDLGVIDLVTPVSGIGLTATEVVSVTVKNFGTLSQTNFPVSYQLDFGPVHTEMFTGTIDPGETALFTFAATSDLSAEGLYSICSWTELAGDEDETNDSIPGCQDVMHFSPVSGTGAYYIYSEVVGYEPGWMMSNTTAMDAVFGAGAWTLDYFEGVDLATVFNENTCFIFLEGSEEHFNDLEIFLNNNRDWVEGWVASGGNLMINASPWEGDGGILGFGDVEITYPYYTYNSEATDPLHPVLNGPFLPVSADLYGFYVGYGTVSGGGVTPIINDIFNVDAYLLAEKDWGEGHVLVGTMGAPEYYTPTEDAQNLRQNMIDYMKLCTPVDIGVVELLSPEGGCGMTNAEDVTILIQNFGPTTVTNVPVKYSLDGGEVAEIAPGPVPVGGTYTYTFAASADLSSPGDHTLDAWTDFSGDEDETNDMLASELTSLETPSLEFGPNMTVCDEVVLDAGNLGSTYEWSTGATTQTITVTESGTYSVTITNPTTGCTATDNVTVTVNYTPDASFTYTSVGLTVIFTNTSTAGASYSWSFGDGFTSVESDPSHTYAVAGDYTVTLTVTNGCGSDFYSIVVEVATGVNDIALADMVNLYPNPTSDFTTVDIQLPSASDVTLELTNTLGEVVWSAIPGNIATVTFEIDMRGFAAGVYQLHITSGNQSAAKQIVLTK